MKKNFMFPFLLSIGALLITLSFRILPKTHLTEQDSDSANLTLPSGFNAMIVAENTGQARHLAVTKSGNIYVKLNRLKGGNGIIYLQDENGDGKMEKQTGFGDYPGTGMTIHDGYLYASSNSDIYRYKLNDKGEVENPNQPETIVTGLLDHGEHNSKSFTFDTDGNIYVNVGAYSNSCQEQDRVPGSMGMPGCPILDSAGGIWKFKADKLKQQYGDGVHYATGLRNCVGIDWNQKINALFVMQHGRDQLHDLFPKYFTEKESCHPSGRMPV